MILLATCAFGLEKLVSDELKNLDCTVLKTEDGRITFEGDEEILIRTNLWLRCADRVQIKMGEFTATTFDELFNAVNSIEWEKYIGKNDAFPIKASSVKSMLHNEPAIQSIVKKAIVKRLQQKYPIETFPEDSGALYHVVLKANKDQFILSIDSSGDSLHKRGYRQKANLAPLKETLAAALVTLSDWSPDRMLVDTFCGSGTILIEAGLMAKNIAPGLGREFAFHNWNWIPKEKFAAAVRQAKSMEYHDQKLLLKGFDIDQEAIYIAKENAHRAGLSEISFIRSDFNELDFGAFKNATMIANPPYGERLEEKPFVETMYRNFGKKFRDTLSTSLFLLTSDEYFPQLFGRQADKNRKLFNGRIRCYLFSFFGK